MYCDNYLYGIGRRCTRDKIRGNMDNLIEAYNNAIDKNDTLAARILYTRIVNSGYEVITELEKYYNENQDILDEAYQLHVSEGEWGSGQDKIKLGDDHFWEFVENVMSKGV